MLGSRVTDLEARLATQGKLLAEREYENNQLRQLNETAERTTKELRDEIAAQRGQISGDRKAAHRKGGGRGAASHCARDERAKLQRDINAIQQQAESSWATERMENALLRERINDIAAEVAKLAMTLEGPNSAIEAMLAAEPATRKARQGRQWDCGAMAAPEAAAARWPNASGRCNTTPPAPASREPDFLGFPANWSGSLDTDAPPFVNRGFGRSAMSRSAAGSSTNSGRIAQRESVPFTRERSKVRSLVRPPKLNTINNLFKCLPPSVPSKSPGTARAQTFP